MPHRTQTKADRFLKIFKFPSKTGIFASFPFCIPYGQKMCITLLVLSISARRGKIR